VIFYGLFAVGLPFSMMARRYRHAIRVPVQLAGLLGRTGYGPVVAERSRCGGVVEFPILDRYWSRFIFRNASYEPELDLLLECCGDELSLFVDGGANIGWWTVTAAQTAQRVIAIDASPETLSFLRANQRRNGNNIDVIVAALWSRSGEEISFSHSSSAHAGSAVTEVSQHDRSSRNWTSTTVTTVTVDEVVEKSGALQLPGLLIVKLDVEGAEVEVLRGAAHVIDLDRTIVVFEEHGRDQVHEATQHLLNEGLEIRYIEPSGMVAVCSPEAVRLIATNRRLGYNFVAYRAGGRAEQVIGNLEKLVAASPER
jgi:FkbM family methyltransferase